MASAKSKAENGFSQRNCEKNAWGCKEIGFALLFPTKYEISSEMLGYNTMQGTA